MNFIEKCNQKKEKIAMFGYIWGMSGCRKIKFKSAVFGIMDGK